MSRVVSKKSTEKRKKPRRNRTQSKGQKMPQNALSIHDGCFHCSRTLKSNDRALFVEEEVGRFFCSEDCISSFFTPEINRLEKDYFTKRGVNDLSGREREKYSYLRWMTLEEPDEVWREKTLAGDYRYTLISEFHPKKQSIWYVCICLCLRGAPSFLYLAFPTRNATMVNDYRRGERIQWTREKGQGEGKIMVDGLADSWTEDETIRAQINQKRRCDDIPPEEFELYQGCFEETLESPNEVWSVRGRNAASLKIYHFIRFYAESQPGVWYVIVAKETEDEEQLEILDAFPTRDIDLVERFRRGEKEVGEPEAQITSCLVH